MRIAHADNNNDNGWRACLRMAHVFSPRHPAPEDRLDVSSCCNSNS
jgi:hypothetical protein